MNNAKKYLSVLITFLSLWLISKDGSTQTTSGGRGLETALRNTYVPGFNWIAKEFREGVLTQNWIHWDQGTNYTSIGYSGAATAFNIAARWTHDQIDTLANESVTKVKFWPSDTLGSAATFRIRIWEGIKGDSLVVDELVPTVIPNQWNEIALTTPYPINTKKDLWVGLEVIVTTGWPAGCDAGPAITGYGDMINLSGAAGWEAMSSFSTTLNYNWNIETCIKSTSGIENIIKKTISIYPNPATDKIIVETSGITPGKALVIYDIEGQDLIQQQVTGIKTTVDISRLPAGVYVVKVTGDRTAQVRKIIKE
jgi:hypothetical protein